MKPKRWTFHARRNLAEREIDPIEAEKTLEQPEFRVPDRPHRQVLMRRYFDQAVQQEMLLRIVVEETTTEILVITVYKTSQLAKYLRGLVP